MCFVNVRNTCFDFAGKNDSVSERRRREAPVQENRNPWGDDDVDDDNYNDGDDEDNDDHGAVVVIDDDYEDPTKKTKSFLKSEEIAMFMAQQNRTTLSSMGHQFEDMVLSCTYRGISCG